MKSFLVIGMGRFGTAVAQELTERLHGRLSGNTVCTAMVGTIPTITPIPIDSTTAPRWSRQSPSPDAIHAIFRAAHTIKGSSRMLRLAPITELAHRLEDVLGSLREILGNGTLFDGADGLLGSWAKSLRVELFHTDTPFLLAMLPPGAFIGLGMLLAIKYLIDERTKQRRAQAVAAENVEINTAEKA